jgi:hypothetical protein
MVASANEKASSCPFRDIGWGDLLFWTASTFARISFIAQVQHRVARSAIVTPPALMRLRACKAGKSSQYYCSNNLKVHGTSTKGLHCRVTLSILNAIIR